MHGTGGGFTHGDICARGGFEKDAAISIYNFGIGMRLDVDALIYKCTVCRGDFEDCHAVGHSAECECGEIAIVFNHGGDAEAVAEEIEGLGYA